MCGLSLQQHNLWGLTARHTEITKPKVRATGMLMSMFLPVLWLESSLESRTQVIVTVNIRNTRQVSIIMTAMGEDLWRLNDLKLP